MNDYRDNMEIDLRDLLFYILKRWKIILLVAVIGLVIGGVYGYYANSEAEKTKEAEEAEEADFPTLASRLTIKERTEVELAYKACLQCKELNDILDSQGTDNNIDTRVELIKASQQLILINSYLSKDQKAYYTALFEQDNSDEVQVVNQSEDTTNDNMQVAEESVNKGNIMKKGFVGMVVAIFLAACVCTAKYAFTSKLRRVEDVRISFNLPIIGTIDANSDMSMPLVHSSVIACAKKNRCQSVYLTSSSPNESMLERCNKISALFAGEELSIYTGESILTDPEAVKKAANADGVILCEGIGESLYENIAREIELCNNCGVAIIGAVIVK